MYLSTQSNLASATTLDQLRVLSGQIGNTPLYPLARCFRKEGVKIFAKLEYHQLGGSIKMRPAFNIVANAVLSGELQAGKRLLDAAAGNMAVAYASVLAALDLQATLVVPAGTSQAKLKMLDILGAEVIIAAGGMAAAQEEAQALLAEAPMAYYFADQANNDDNWRAHYKHTAMEINQQTRGKVTHFVSGEGSGGTLKGTGKRLQELNADIELLAAPKVAFSEVEGLIHHVARSEGLLLSYTSATNLLAAIELAESLDSGVVVTVFPEKGGDDGST